MTINNTNPLMEISSDSNDFVIQYEDMSEEEKETMRKVSEYF